MDDFSKKIDSNQNILNKTVSPALLLRFIPFLTIGTFIGVKEMTEFRSTDFNMLNKRGHFNYMKSVHSTENDNGH